LKSVGAPTTKSVDGRIVRETRIIADNVLELCLESSSGERLPDWTSGAHIDLILPGGLTRQYSLCGDRWDAYTYRVAVLHEPNGRGASAFIHDHLRAGDKVEFGVSRNNFRLVPAEQYVFLAGGIGITPLFPMIYQADLLGADWHLIYVGRSHTMMAYCDALAGYGDRVSFIARNQPGGDEPIELLGHWSTRLPSAPVYCCGPELLVSAAVDRAAGWHSHRLRIERFIPVAPPSSASDKPFTVELRRSGVTLSVGPGQSVLDTVANAGASVLSSCQRGTCGTCETGVLEGTPDHRDSIMDDIERADADYMFICVSRSTPTRLFSICNGRPTRSHSDNHRGRGWNRTIAVGRHPTHYPVKTQAPTSERNRRALSKEAVTYCPADQPRSRHARLVLQRSQRESGLSERQPVFPRI
jgi:ferredoxin-NADP reductase